PKRAARGLADRLRGGLARHPRLERAAPLDEPTAHAFGAAVYPMALVAARAEPAGTETTATTFGPKLLAASFPQRQLETGPWILAAGADRIARRLRSAFPTVADRWTPPLGLTQGADDRFLGV